MARRLSINSTTTNSRPHRRTITESLSETSHDDQRNQLYLERYRLLSAKVERCVQELVERVYRENRSLNFELLAPPASHSSSQLYNDNKEYYFDFYLVWQNLGKIRIERDASSICCQIKYIDSGKQWSRAERDRLLLSNVDKKKSTYLNGRAMRDLFFETLHQVSPDLIRLDFVEHLIYFDLLIPTPTEKSTCHITLLPSVHLSDDKEVLLPFGTLRWYPRSLSSADENSALILFEQPLANMTIRGYLASEETNDETAKITRVDQQAFARVRTIIHELLLPCTLAHVESMEQLRAPFENREIIPKQGFFIPHRSDRNCNVFPAGQYLLNNTKAKQFFTDFLRTNTKTVNGGFSDVHEDKF